MVGINISILFLLINTISSEGGILKHQPSDEEFPFKFLPINKFSVQKSILIYYSNTTKDLLDGYFELHKDKPTTLINADMFVTFENIKPQNVRSLFIILFEKEREMKFDEIMFSDEDIFVYVECDKYNITERVQICKSNISTTAVAALYNPFTKIMYICSYYENNQTASVVKLGKENRIPITRTYKNFNQYQFKVGYLIYPPYIERQVLRTTNSHSPNY